MKRTVTISLNGIVFHIDDDAYDTLINYFSEIKTHFTEDERVEIMNDIEARVCELLSEKLFNHKNVINIDDVKNVIAILGSPNDFSENDSENFHKQDKKTEKSERKKHRKYFRDPDNMMLGGVLSGLAAYINWDVNLVRLLFLIVAVLGFGWVVAAYFIIWIITPEAKTVAQKLEMTGEEASLENIRNYLESERFKDSMNNVGNRLANIVRPLLKIIFLFVGITISIICIAIVGMLIVVAISSIFYLSSDNLFNYGIESSFFTNNSFIFYTILTTVLLTLIIPIISITMSVINLILRHSNKKPIKIHSAIKWTGGIVWLLGIITLITTVVVNSPRCFGYNNSTHHFYNNETNSNTNMYEVKEFNNLEVSTAINVTIIDSDSNYIVVEAPDDLIKDFKYEVYDNTLKLFYDDSYITSKLKYDNIKVKIYKTSLNKITAEAASYIKSIGTIKANYINIKASAASNININVDATNVECEANTASNITINAICEEMMVKSSAASNVTASGVCDKLELSANATSNCDFENMNANIAKVKTSSMSHARVRAKSLNMRATSMSKITYFSTDSLGDFDKVVIDEIDLGKIKKGN